MRRAARRFLLFLVSSLAVVAAVIFWKGDDLQRLRAVLTLFDEERIVTHFSNMDRLFFHRPVPTAPGAPAALPVGHPLPDVPGLEPWAEARKVTALVVLHHGKLVHERYRLGTLPEDRRVSWSVAKSFLSALVGIALEQGHIKSLDDPVTRYVPELVGTAYAGATVRNVLNMASGVRFDEDYLDFHSDINRMGRVLALGASMDQFATGLAQRDHDPGAVWQYVSIDTHVLGMVLRGATGRSVIDLMGEQLLAPLGLESEPYYVTDGEGVAFVLGGLNMRTRDYARFGQMFLQDGCWQGRQVVPADWVVRSTSPSAPTAPGAIRYGYHWWVPKDGESEFFARGVYGQGVYVNRNAGVVIAMNGADRAFRDEGVWDRNIEMFRDISETLARQSVRRSVDFDGREASYGDSAAGCRPTRS